MRRLFRFLGRLLDVLYKLVIIFLGWPVYLFFGLGNLALSAVILIGAVMDRDPLIFLLGIGWLLGTLVWFYVELPTFTTRYGIYYNRTWGMVAIAAAVLILLPIALGVFKQN